MTYAGIYIHIPFCRSRCSYCDFATGMYESGIAGRYVSALCAEIKAWREVEQLSVVDTIYIGGGTPSLLEPTQIARILNSIKDRFEVGDSAEITLEINPGDGGASAASRRESMSLWLTAGINRAFIGENPIKALLDPYNPIGSTNYVNFNTSRQDRWETSADRCHVNWIILDSDWEAEFCRVAESHSRVRSYVKNHNLGLEVPYRFGSETRLVSRNAIHCRCADHARTAGGVMERSPSATPINSARTSTRGSLIGRG